MKSFLVICLLLTLRAHAVILLGSGDPTYNTTAPTGALLDSGWQWQGQWGSFLGTPISPNHFITADHVGGSVGDVFTLNGISYITIGSQVSPDKDLRIWEVAQTFLSYAPLYSGSDEEGKSLMVFGRGTQRGSAYFHSDGVTFRGWENGASDGVMRWGENTVYSASDKYLRAIFDSTEGANEATLSGGDSGGAVFIQENGIWKLAGINRGVFGTLNAPDDASFFATRISTEQDWILAAVPEPIDSGLAVALCLLLFVCWIVRKDR